MRLSEQFLDLLKLCFLVQDGDVDLDSAGQGGIVYRVHDYAYVASASEDTVVQRHIMRIERLYRDTEGQTFARGIWCYRPEETFHLATRKFCENVCYNLRHISH